MRVTVAEPQGDAREGGAERSGRQNCDHRNTNRQRGRRRAASVLANTKPKAHQDAAGRAGWRAGKVQALTRGGLPRESAEGVSRSHSSSEQSRGLEDARLNCETGTLPAVKGRRKQQQRSTEHCAAGPNTPIRQQTAAARLALRESVLPARCNRGKESGERNSRAHA
jgi:hypothetical protein